MKSSSKGITGWILLLVLSVAPIFLWALAPASVPRFAGSTALYASLGQILALVGTSMFALNLILSARFKWIESLFNGLNQVYTQHARFGQIAFLLLLFHPLLLLPKYVGNSSEHAVQFLLPVNGLEQNLGWFSLVIMILLIILTLYLRPRYQFWKLTHKFFGLAFFLGAVHGILIPSDISAYAPLKTMMLIYVVAGLLAYAYRSLFARWLVPTHAYTVAQVRKLNNSVVEISMNPTGKALSFEPGQFIFIKFKSGEVSSEVHPFSITSASGSSDLSITVKQLGDYTNQMLNIAPGDTAVVEGPFGAFHFEQGTYKEQIWVAGGIGITPFVSMARSLPKEAGYQVDLYYCTRNQEELVYLDELQRMAPYVRVVPYMSEAEGYITAEKIEHMSGTLRNKSVYLCAPMPMIQSLKKQLGARGVAPNLIHSEEFNFA